MDRERLFSSRVAVGYWSKLAAEYLRPDRGYALTRAGPIVAHVHPGVCSLSSENAGRSLRRWIGVVVVL